MEDEERIARRGEERRKGEKGKENPTWASYSLLLLISAKRE